MTDPFGISFTVLGIEPEPFAAAPNLTARVAISVAGDQPVHAMALRAQVRIEPRRRAYDAAEAAGLVDLFGARERWHDTQQTFPWLHCATTVPGFSGAVVTDLPMQCTYDFDVRASKYLHALRDGAVPLTFLFSGTVFVKGPSGFAVQHIPWDCEDRYAMPVTVWRELMDHHFPNSGWLRLSHETIAALSQYKSGHGLLGFDDTVSRLLTHNSKEQP